MARYSSIRYIERGFGKHFTYQFRPESIVPISGIYHCINCGDEVAVAKGGALPPSGHHQHSGVGPVIWRLIVEAREIVRSSAAPVEPHLSEAKLRETSSAL